MLVLEKGKVKCTFKSLFLQSGESRRGLCSSEIEALVVHAGIF